MNDEQWLDNLRTTLAGVVTALEEDRAARRLIRNGKWALQITAAGVTLAELVDLDPVEALADILESEIEQDGGP